MEKSMDCWCHMTDSKVFLHTNSKRAALCDGNFGTCKNSKLLFLWELFPCSSNFLFLLSDNLSLCLSYSHIQVSNFYFLKISKKLCTLKTRLCTRTVYSLWERFFMPFYSVLYVTLMIMKHTNKKNLFLNWYFGGMTLFSPSKATSYHFQYSTNDVDLLADCHTRMLIFKMPRCRASLDCPAFLIDYDKEACFKLDTNSEDNRQVFFK